MIKEQDKAIERCNKLIETEHSNWIGITNQKAIETVLNMLKEKEAEIEKYKKLLADNLAKNLNDSIKAKEKANTDLEFLNLGWKIELEKKDKIIDLILDKLNQGRNVFENSEIKEIIEIYEEIKSTSDLRGIELRKNCIKQYFERKLEYGR
jgi:hypothetical protein